VCSIDPAYKLLQSLAKQLIVLDPDARRDCHDDQGDLAFVLRPGGQEPVEGLQTLHDALGVVQPVDRQDDLAIADGIADLVDLASDLSIVRGIRVFLEIDAQGEGVHLHDSLMHGDLAHRVLQAADPGRTAEEMADIVVGVETDQVGAEESLEDLLPPGEQAIQFRRRPGDVQEVADVVIGMSLPQHLGQEHQLEDVDPDRIARHNDFHQHIDEQRVHMPVRRPMILHERRADQEIVE